MPRLSGSFTRLRYTILMCGRFTLDSDLSQLTAHFDLQASSARESPSRYNISPNQQIAIIRNIEGLGRRLDLVHWGLIPSWAKTPKIGHRLINARSETLASKPSFRSALKRRRCLIPANGFYEWKTTGAHKQPFWIGLKGRQLFSFAGLWEHWQDPGNGRMMESCTIITTSANASLARIHERMPVLLTSQASHLWLSPGELQAAQISQCLQPTPDAKMLSYPVSRAVNNPGNDHEGLIAPVL